MDSQIDGETNRWLVEQTNGWLDVIHLQTNNKFFNCPKMIFLFLKGMTGALAPFSYIVNIGCSKAAIQTVIPALLMRMSTLSSFSINFWAQFRTDLSDDCCQYYINVFLPRHRHNKLECFFQAKHKRISSSVCIAWSNTNE